MERGWGGMKYWNEVSGERDKSSGDRIVFTERLMDGLMDGWDGA